MGPAMSAKQAAETPHQGSVAELLTNRDPLLADDAGASFDKTSMLALSELDQVDVVAWLVPLEGAFETLVLRDRFRVAVGSGDYSVEAAEGHPVEAVFDLDPAGNWAVAKRGGSSDGVRLLRDNERFFVGATEFLFKLAARFSSKQHAAACLQVVGGVDDGRQVALPEGVVVCVGTDQSCSGVIRGEGLGPRHLLAERRDASCQVADLGCEAGVVLNGEKIGVTTLRPNDEIQVGALRLIFRFHAEPGASS